MPPRPSFRSKDSARPLSAIYIGNQSNASNNNNNNDHASSGPITASVGTPSPLPDLPEPPSPVSSAGSGLPSPPATNSTGSGSTGDPGSVAVRRPPSAAPVPATPMSGAQSTTPSNTITNTGSSDSSSTIPTSSRSSSRLSWKVDDQSREENEHDEDSTMRLKVGASNEAALQRAHKLIQRSKLQLDKMAPSRLATASPASTSSPRINRHSLPEPSQVLSGSETEREGDSLVFNSTSSSGSRPRTSDSATYTRLRLSSAPTSPHKIRSQTPGGSGGGGPHSPTRRRKRISLASMSSASFNEYSDDDIDNYDERAGGRDGERYEVGTARDRIRDRHDTLRDDRVSTRSPSATLNNLKRTPLGGARRRSALPREFREGSADEYPNPINTDLPSQTPYRPPSATALTSSSTATTTTTTTSTSTMSNLARRSTVRSGRGLSEDFRNSPAYSTRDLPSSSSSNFRSGVRNAPMTTFTPPTSASSSKTTHTFDNSPTLNRANTIGRQTQTGGVQRERRQSLRGGSAESALGGAGRSLVGEGLRAAGLSRRGTLGKEKERERTISASGEGLAATRDARGGSVASSSDVSGSNDRASAASVDDADVFRDGERRVNWSPDTLQSSSRQRRAFNELGARGAPPRAATSMADYSYTSRSRHQMQSDDEDEEGPDDEREGRSSRMYKSPLPLVTSREASLTRREQALLEKERELGRRERELERAGSALGRHQVGITTTPITSVPSPSLFSSARDRYTSPFGSTRRTAQPATQVNQGGGQQHQMPSEHERLMIESLSMFESQLSKLAPSLGPGPNHAEMLSRNAQALVLSADRLNTMLRAGNSKALDAQIEAEVDGDIGAPGAGGSRSLVEVWRKIGGDYREGLRVSDELVRAVTGLLLGVGRVMKEYVHLGVAGGVEGMGLGGSQRGSPSVHGRSISLDEDVRGRGSLSPDFATGTASTGSGSGTRESRRSWESNQAGAGGGGSSNASASTGAGSREEALRKLAGVRSDSPLARASPAFQAARELDRLETASPALGASGLGLPKVNMPVARRLFAPSQQREMALVASAHDIQDANYDPSPTPISRTRVFERGELGVPFSQQQVQGRSPLQQSHQLEEVTLERRRTLPPFTPSTVAQPDVNTTPSPAPAPDVSFRRNATISGGTSVKPTSSRDRHERRKVSVTSITTVRAMTNFSNGSTSSTTSTMSSALSGVGPPGFQSLKTPSGATTAVTFDGAIGMVRTEGVSDERATAGESMYAMPAKPTFSRPEGLTSVTGLQQQLEGYRKRTESENAVLSDGSGNVNVGGSGTGADEGGGGKGKNGINVSLITPEWGKETRRKTFGLRDGARMSLDGGGGVAGDEVNGVGVPQAADGGGRAVVVDLSVNAADRSAAVALGGTRSERRKTLTDIWPRS